MTHLQNVWPEISRRLPRCPDLSTTLHQHLAVRSDCAPEWKEFLLLDALRRAHSVAVVVNLRDQRSREEEDFYVRYGFESQSLDRFWLPMTTIAKLFEAESARETCSREPYYHGE